MLRVASERDVAKAESLVRRGEEAMPVFRDLIRSHGLDMKPVGVESLFGGEKAVFYFAAEERVDFRQLVKDLSSTLHIRVDMRQIGVRDETRLVGGYAQCGQELCCTRFGGQFEPVSIRMAKEQDLPLNSSKISGVCGRLMCCLRYEFEAYRDFKSRAPKRNAVIDTPLGKAKIVEYNTPRETITMRLENGKSFTVALSEMSCSQECKKKAQAQNSPLRPDTVSREALERIGTAEIALQLAELDRASNPEAYELDSSLLTKTRQRRPSHTADADAQAKDAAQRQAQPRKRRSAGGAAQKAEGDAQAAQDSRPPQRKGMRPRRQAASKQQAQPEGGQTAAQQPRRTQQGQQRATDKAAEATRAQHRARRHHTVAETPAQGQPGATTRVRTPRKPGDGQERPAQEGSGTPRQRRQHVAGQAADAKRPQSPKPKQGGEPRKRHAPDQQRPQAQGQEQQGQAKRRRRRPGDKGGAQAQD